MNKKTKMGRFSLCRPPGTRVRRRLKQQHLADQTVVFEHATALLGLMLCLLFIKTVVVFDETVVLVVLEFY